MGGQNNGVWTPTKRRGPIAAEFSSPGPAAIALKSSIGHGGATRSRPPAFTMASRHENKLDKAGPGPGQYNVTGLSNKGKDEPAAASMHIRPRDTKSYVTPAPCDYSPDKAETKVNEASPCFSFGIKVENGKANDAPAPNSYNIPSLLGSTKEGSKHSAPSFTMAPRAQDEEDKMKVPGPGSYDDATVDKYKTIKSPCFSMGQRTTIPSDHTMKPGPGAHCPEKYNDTGPMFTMRPRIEDIDHNKVPGPGTYDAGDINNCREKLPAFTMRPKTTLPTDHTNKPAPNAYAPEKYHDAGPMFTMRPRIEDIDHKKVPGPGTYDAGDINNCREKLPAYTMRPKTTLPGDNTKKPAPNAYAPEKYIDAGPMFTMRPRIEDIDHKKVPGPGTYEAGDINNCREKLPAYTMRPKTTLPTDHTKKPAPNAYAPEKYIDAGPMFTMRPRIEDIDHNKVPGPGTYEAGDINNCREKLPAFTMAPKTTLPTDHTSKPAPNAYAPEKYQDSGPKFTMAQRIKINNKNTVPGPGAYEAGDINNCREKLPAFTMAPKTTLPTDHTTKPAPNAYAPEKYIDVGPMFTMRPRIEDIDHKKVPGPGTYEAGDINNCREKLPAFTMAPKTTLPTDHTTKPAPNAYAPEKYQDQGPMFSMAQRLPDHMKNEVPGPGAYESGDMDMCKEKLPAFTMAPKTTLPTDHTPKPAPNAYSPEKYVPSGPKFSMVARPAEEVDKMSVPGPGSYESGDLDNCRGKQPAFTMAPKTTMPVDHTQKPAPNAYNPDKSESSEKPATPHFSFGVKHSQYLGQLRVQ